MTTDFALQAQTREEQGKQVKQLRQAGSIPAVIYGHGFANQNVKLTSQAFSRIFHKAGHSGLVELSINDKEPIHVLIADVQTDHLGNPQHIDFHQVKMDELIRAEVPLRLVGEAPAVYNLGGSLIQTLEEIEVEALPANLPQMIEVDVSVLVELDSSLSVSDLDIPAKVEVLTDEHEMICKAEPPRSDDEMEALDAEMGDAVGEAAAVEGEDAPAEGDAPAEAAPAAETEAK